MNLRQITDSENPKPKKEIAAAAVKENPVEKWMKRRKALQVEILASSIYPKKEEKKDADAHTAVDSR